MIIILASIADEAAVDFADEMSTSTAVSVVTCKDLALGSTALRHPDFRSSTLTVAGQKILASSISGVVNLLPAVFPDELFFYPPEEREYQAAEFHALLTFFLASLSCRVINRPTSMSLSGSYPSLLGWYHLARRVGVPVADIHFNSEEFASPFAGRQQEESLKVGYLHGNILPASTHKGADYTRTLAKAAKLEYLRATFTRCRAGVQLAAVNTVPNLRDWATRKALTELLMTAGAAQ